MLSITVITYPPFARSTDLGAYQSPGSVRQLPTLKSRFAETDDIDLIKASIRLIREARETAFTFTLSLDTIIIALSSSCVNV
jgi:hypothetical protein